MAFLDGATEVTDLDADGFGELTFAYSLACRSDMSPARLKLLMLENGEKFILRGTTNVPGVGGGQYTVDASFKAGPPALLEHAKKVWKRQCGGC